MAAAAVSSSSVFLFPRKASEVVGCCRIGRTNVYSFCAEVCERMIKNGGGIFGIPSCIPKILEDDVSGRAIVDATFPFQGSWRGDCCSSSSRERGEETMLGLISKERRWISSKSPSTLTKTKEKMLTQSSSSLSPPQSLSSSSSSVNRRVQSVYNLIKKNEEDRKFDAEISASMDRWKKKMEIKNSRVKAPIIYDGPLWVKYWIKKRRPGCRS